MVAERPAGQLDRLRHLSEVVAHHRQVGCLDGDVGAGAHGDAQVRLRQRRGVVDAVPGHGHSGAGCLQLPHGLDLALRQHPGVHVLRADPDGGRHLGGHSGVVAGQQDRPEPESRSRATAAAEPGLTVSRRLMIPAVSPSTATQTAVAPGVFGSTQRLALSRGRVDAVLQQPAGAPRDHAPAVDRAIDAAAGCGAEAGDGGKAGAVVVASVPRANAAAAMARAIGCSEAFSTAPARRSTSASLCGPKLRRRPRQGGRW